MSNKEELDNFLNNLVTQDTIETSDEEVKVMIEQAKVSSEARKKIMARKGITSKEYRVQAAKIEKMKKKREKRVEEERQLRDKLRGVLKSLDLEMEVGGCGCCDSPRLLIKHKGATLVDRENFNFATDLREDETNLNIGW